MAAACAAKGGSIQPVGKAQIPVCVTPYADAGKACTDKSQCQGACVLEGNLEAHGPGHRRLPEDRPPVRLLRQGRERQVDGAICVD
jgi:hypothetical protein